MTFLDIILLAIAAIVMERFWYRPRSRSTRMRRP